MNIHHISLYAAYGALLGIVYNAWLHAAKDYRIDTLPEYVGFIAGYTAMQAFIPFIAYFAAQWLLKRKPA